jgi:DNA-binding transcriptional MerR regulator
VETTRLTVGQLAEAAGTTAKALRHYDRIGLFPPDDVDGDTGYRWYGSDRLPQARLIARLRSVGVPLDDVAACLAAAGDPEVVERVLADHRRRLESRLTRVRGDLHGLTHLTDDLEQDDGAAPELPRTAPATPVPAATDERQLAVDLFNGVWRLMETDSSRATSPRSPGCRRPPDEAHPHTPAQCRTADLVWTPCPTRPRTDRRSAASRSPRGSTGSATPAAGSSTWARPRASASG